MKFYLRYTGNIYRKDHMIDLMRKKSWIIYIMTTEEKGALMETEGD